MSCFEMLDRDGNGLCIISGSCDGMCGEVAGQCPLLSQLAVEGPSDWVHRTLGQEWVAMSASRDA